MTTPCATPCPAAPDFTAAAALTEATQAASVAAPLPAATLPAAAHPPRGMAHHLALAVLLTGSFLPPLDFFIVNLALPAIRTGLNASSAELQLIISSYASAYAVFLITGGRLGDLFGRKRMFMAGMAGFVLASALCGLAPTGNVLILGRVLQGLAASVMAPQVLATLRSLFSHAEQPRIMALYGTVFGLAAIVGQLGGGMLITWHPFGLGWQSIFWVNVPIGTAALIGAARLIPESPRQSGTRIDLVGVALLSLCLGLLIYPLTHGREAGWPAWTFLCLAASVPTLWVFVWFERRVQRSGGDPLIHLELFDNRPFVIGLGMSSLFYFMAAFFLTYGVYLQNGLGLSPLASGVAILPYALGFLIGPLMSPAVARRLGSHVLNLGFGMMATGLALVIAVLHWGEPLSPLFYACMLFAGTGQGLVLPSLVRIVLADVEPQRVGVASGIVTSLLQIGAALGVALVAGVFYSVLGERGDRPAYTTAFISTLAILAALMVICVGFGTLLTRHHGKVR